MNYQVLLCAVLIIMPLGVVASSFAPPHEGARTFFDYTGEYGPGLNISVPDKPLTPEGIVKWGIILDASDAQMQYMHRKYIDFVEKHNAYLEREAPRYLPLTTELADLWKTIGPNTPEVASQMKKVDQASARVRRELIALEHGYIDSIQPVLTPEQSEKAMLLRLEATRRNCRTFWTMARWSHLELRDIWMKSVAAQAVPMERDEVEDILADYERRLTPVICKRADVVFDIRTRLTELRIAMERGELGRDEGLARYDALLRRRLDAALQERALHEEAVKQVQHVLREGLATKFALAVREAVFPEIYPDPAALHVLLETMSSAPEFSDEIRRAIALNLHQYRELYHGKSSDIERVCVHWGDQTEAGVIGFEHQFLPGALREPLEERLQLSREYLVRLTHLVGAEIMEGYRSMIPTVLTGKAPAADMQTVDTTD
ncbi:MAG TPA: hypothetical protein PK098_01240 [Phycisphaerales bacterium]|nr:hypothetical protein [Phycisphaerales bacterium]